MVSFVKPQTCLDQLRLLGELWATCELDKGHKGQHKEVRDGLDFGREGEVVITWVEKKK